MHLIIILLMNDGFFNNKLFLRIYDSFGCYHEEMIEFRVLAPKVYVYPTVTRNNEQNLRALLHGGGIPKEDGFTKDITGLFPDDYSCLITQISEVSGSTTLQNASIGYFENSSDTFPYEQGIVLLLAMLKRWKDLNTGSSNKWYRSTITW